MVNNQIEFNNKYSKEIKEIKITDEYDFQGQLIIEDYLNLEKLHLQDIDSIDKIILKDLPRLENCVIWNCGLKELIIEDCLQIKKLNVRTNLLAKIQFLQFLQFLPNLEELELDGNAEISSGLEYLSSSLKTFTYENTKLTELLKPYQGNWKVYQKKLQELIELANNRPQELLGKFQSLQKKISKLKEKQPITIDNSIDFEKKYQKLKGTLNFLIKEEEELKSKEIDALITDDLIESIKEQKNDLHKLQKTKKELEKQLVYFEQLLLIKRQKIEQKERGLEELKIAVKDKLNNEEWKILEELLEVQSDFMQSNSPFVFKQIEKDKNKLSSKLTTKELDNLCQLQAEVTQLKLEIQKKLDQINQTFHIENQVINQEIKHIQGFSIEGSNNTFTNLSVQDNIMETITREEENEQQAAIESSLPNTNKFLN